MKDARGQAKAERHNPDQAKQCVVCGRWFSKRKDSVCSKKCAERLDEGGEGDMANLTRTKDAAIGLVLSKLNSQETGAEASPMRSFSEAAE